MNLTIKKILSITDFFSYFKLNRMAKSDRATCWSVTINNPTASDDENLALAKQKGWKVEGQLEKGALTGTPHYQLIVSTPQVRCSQIKKAFPRAHIEICRNKEALLNYVKKEDTRAGELPLNDTYPSMSKVMDWYGEFHSTAQKTYGHECFDFLEVFDQMVNQKIREGYYVESIGVNPQVRSSIKRYGKAIAHRYIHRQKDRQTTDTIAEVNSITTDNESSESLQEGSEIKRTADNESSTDEDGESGRFGSTGR